MKGIVYRNYGPPDVLSLEEIDKPSPGDRQVLIRVRAASVNPYDWHFMRGTPYLVRLFAGLRKPKVERLGADVSGVVEAVGTGVTEFKSGDAVFGALAGAAQGAFAQYACAPDSAIVLKPDNVTFEQAAAVPIAAFTALQGLRDKAKIQPGEKVLINGASGGVGTFAVQIAKSYDAHVTGVCSSRNADMVSSIGADRVIDYNREDFTRGTLRYDLIFDAVGNHSFAAYKRVLNPEGKLVVAGGPDTPWMIGPLAGMIKEMAESQFGSQKRISLFSKLSKSDLTVLQGLMQSGKVTPVIDRSYTLREVPDAIRYVETKHARGKVVITIGE